MPGQGAEARGHSACWPLDGGRILVAGLVIAWKPTWSLPVNVFPFTHPAWQEAR